MKLFYIAFARSIHTIKWVNYFKKDNDIMLVSFYPSDPIEGVDLQYLPLNNKNFAIFKTGKIKKLIDIFKPDILHAHYASSCGITAAMTGFHPYVLSVWGDDILNFPNKSPVHKWVVNRAIKKADHVTATSHMLSDATKRLIGHDMDIEVVPFGVDLNQYTKQDRPARDFIHVGTVRNLTPKYGIEYLIKAVGKCIEQDLKVKLTIVGDGVSRQLLEDLVGSLKLDNSVAFTGAVTNEKVVEYLSDFDIFVMPSVGEGETFGVAAVEAMATGLPVIASKVGGLPEVIDDDITGMHVRPGNVDDLIEAITRYANSDQLRNQHGLNGRAKVVREYDWQENAKQMAELYRSILK